MLIGATGATGKHVLRELLACDDFTQVIEAGRRVTSAEIIADYKGKEKLKQKIIDFENLSDAGLKEDNIDVLLITVRVRFMCRSPNQLFTRSALRRQRLEVRRGLSMSTGRILSKLQKQPESQTRNKASSTSRPAARARLLPSSICSKHISAPP